MDWCKFGGELGVLDQIHKKNPCSPQGEQGFLLNINDLFNLNSNKICHFPILQDY